MSRLAGRQVLGLIVVLAILIGLLAGIVVIIVKVAAGGGDGEEPKTAAEVNDPPPGPVTPLPASADGLRRFSLDADPTVVLVLVPGGTFTMGRDDGASDERPAHPVTLDPFLIAEKEITNAQFLRFCKAVGRLMPADPLFRDMTRYVERFPNHPVVNVSWNDAAAYCRWAGLRLPTEAQWEYAARIPDDRPYPWGSMNPDATRANYSGYEDDEAWLDEGRGGRDTWKRDGWVFTAPVGSFPAGRSRTGLLDLAGNVVEWCRDGAFVYSRAARAGDGYRGSGDDRVVRGGGYLDAATALRATYRDAYEADHRSKDLGFRPARVAPE